MKEKLTIDQKLQIAQIAGDIVKTGMNNNLQPAAVVASGVTISSEQELLEHLYGVIENMVTCESEQQ